MTTDTPRHAAAAHRALLANVTFEMTSGDLAELAKAAGAIPRGAEIFVTNLPRDTGAELVQAAAEIRRHGFVPVPHIVARNIASEAALDALLASLAGEAGVDRALVLGGDRNDPLGPFDAAMELLRTDLLQKHGIARSYFACYPEGHPRIPGDALEKALSEKLAYARETGIAAGLVSQFAFASEPIVAMARRLRATGATEPLRIGFAGPVGRVKLMKYAIRCGVGASLRLLRNRADLSLGLLASETPDALVAETADWMAKEPSLDIGGIHLFTFGALANSAQWVQSRRTAEADRPQGLNVNRV